MSMNDCSGGRSWGRCSVRKHSMCQRWLFKDNYLKICLRINVSEVTLKKKIYHPSPRSPAIKPVIAGDEQVWVCTKNAKLVWSWAGLWHQFPRRAAPSFQGLTIWRKKIHFLTTLCGIRCVTALPMWAAQGWGSTWWGGSWGTPLPSRRARGEREGPERTVIMKKRRSGE